MEAEGGIIEEEGGKAGKMGAEIGALRSMSREGEF
jgi:hypothetical protein